MKDDDQDFETNLQSSSSEELLKKLRGLYALLRNEKPKAATYSAYVDHYEKKAKMIESEIRRRMKT